MPMVSREAAETIYDDPDAVQTMMPDELRVFSDYVANSMMVTEENVVGGAQPVINFLGKVCVIRTR